MTTDPIPLPHGGIGGRADAEPLPAGLREQIASRNGAAAGSAPPADVGGALARADVSLRRAAEVTDVGVALPPFTHLGILRRAVAQLSGRILLYLLRLITTDQRQFNRLLRDAAGDLRLGGELLAAELAARGSAQDAALVALRAELTGTRAGLEATVQAARTGLEATVQAARTGLEAAAEAAAQAARDELDAVRAALASHDARLTQLELRGAELPPLLDDLRATASYLRRRVADRDEAVEALLAEVGAARATAPGVADAPRAPAPARTEAAAAAPGGELPLDAWQFSETFHSDEATVRELQRQYVPYFAGRGDVLDIGCGRGEFLDLMREADVPARGIDLSQRMVLHCRAKGLAVTEAEALEHLAALPDGALGGIFCAQVVEHMPPEAMAALVRLAYAKLRADGVLLIETLNPECLLVHYRWFWMDLTHVRLVHPETLKFLYLSNGFRALEGRYTPAREPVPQLPALELPGEAPPLREAFNTATQHLNTLLHGSPDYALVGRR